MRCQTFSFSFFPSSADHERDWPPCKVVFFGLATNALNVRNNNIVSGKNPPLYCTFTLIAMHACVVCWEGGFLSLRVVCMMWSYFVVFICYSFPSLSLPGNDFLCWLHFSYSSHSSVYFQHKQDWLHVPYFFACIISCVVCWEGWFSCPTRSIMGIWLYFVVFYLLFLSFVVPSWQLFSLLATFSLFVSFFCLFSTQAKLATRTIFFCCLHYFFRSLLGRVVFLPYA